MKLVKEALNVAKKIAVVSFTGGFIFGLTVSSFVTREDYVITVKQG